MYNPDTLYLDLETYSTIELKTCGSYKYAEAVEILIVAFALGDEPVIVWDRTDPAHMSYALTFADRLARCADICAHHSTFDRWILGKFEPAVLKKFWRDTMIKALAHSMPGALGAISDILHLPKGQTKEKAGRALIYLFCKPQKDGSRLTRKTNPAEWREFLHYAGNDIRAMRRVDDILPAWNDTEFERELWQLDQKINDRGFMVDVDFAEKARALCVAEKKRLDAETKKATGGYVNAATQRDALLAYILVQHGVDLPDMTQSTLKRRLEDQNLPDAMRHLIALRMDSAGTATSKYKTLLRSTNADGRLRGTLQFCGASRTGRWAGRQFQPQNLPRPKFKAQPIYDFIDAVKDESADLVYDNLADYLGSAIRGCLIAPPGKKLVVADLASIEGRVLAWLAGEQWKIKAYEDLDRGMGYDMYVWAYARTFGVDPGTVNKDQRQLGKPIELAMGYGGGVGAFLTFAAVYHVDLEALAANVYDKLAGHATDAAGRYYHILEEKTPHKLMGLSREVFATCDAIKRLWREANPAIVTFWQQLENAYILAFNTGRPQRVGCVAFSKAGRWIPMRLPSGRFVCYPGARVGLTGKLRYLGTDAYRRRWGPIATYSGKLAENCTQATSRDILAEGMVAVEAAGYEIVLSVHDELITEAPDLPGYSVGELCELMAQVPDWSPGLPLAAAGFEAYRYRKE